VHSARSKAHSSGMRVVNVSGGGTRSEKLQQLGAQGAHIVVGTPKRIKDMGLKEQLSLLRVTFLVLESADRILQLGMGSLVSEIGSWVRPERQTIILAATWPKPLKDIASTLCHGGGDPVRIIVSASEQAEAEAEATPAAATKGKEAATADFPEEW